MWIWKGKGYLIMYVNPFWLGVATTIGVEAIIILALAIFMATKKR